MTYPTYFEALDHEQLLKDYPVGDAFTARYAAMSRDELFALQDAQFRRLMERGWQVPFYRRLWGEKGIEPGDIRGLEDITKLPVYDKSDLMASIAQYPPYGDFHGMGDPASRPPTIFHTTSGTTGKPQTLMFGPKGREVGNLLVGRMYRWMGLEPGDVVHSVYGHGMINGGHYIREAVTHFTNSVFLSAGTGIETRSVNQVRLMADFGVTTIVGFVDYIRKLAATAEEEGLFDKIAIRMIIGHLGTEDRASTEAAWHGAKAYDWYGVGDTGTIAGEGPERDGMYVWEDAQYLELLDVDTGEPVAPGGTGDMVVTCLYKDDIAPCIRFNTHDVTHELDGRGEIVFKRIAGFKGRSDNMVKLRGINVFPHAIGAIIENRADLTGEYVCHLRRDASQRDAMTVTLESRGGSDRAELAETLRRGLGVEVEVELVPPGGTAGATEIDTRQKPLRLIDERGL
ncbi:phenylacetate--CoA ligase family protein [Erythrobacter sp. HL-111]|uniref:phenylacetate--CoA ligase family protein n=1 Tax=Erythrobacter sp. HL-111 TaxID=1798193 RepID=UPI0006DA0544|nr:phenylacetate--CoA ligase family protein [Erythrobacter sp. HL-111]KPP94904.1 MAG: phenylacetyl-CoA ligase PaaK [Erythrobacteraceae bacterium HL-111]SDS90574.1 phenylacetate-CoA ligase [Erythrobacter sp. HL-111]